MAKIYLKASLLVIWLGSGISEDIEHYQAASRIFDEIIRYKRAVWRRGGGSSSIRDWVNDVPSGAADRASTTCRLLLDEPSR
jgi:hypothetical protein